MLQRRGVLLETVSFGITSYGMLSVFLLQQRLSVVLFLVLFCDL